KSFQTFPKLDRRTQIVHALEDSESSARKLRDRKPSLFNAFEIFDHTDRKAGNLRPKRLSKRHSGVLLLLLLLLLLRCLLLRLRFGWSNHLRLQFHQQFLLALVENWLQDPWESPQVLEHGVLMLRCQQQRLDRDRLQTRYKRQSLMRDALSVCDVRNNESSHVGKRANGFGQVPA